MSDDTKEPKAPHLVSDQSKEEVERKHREGDLKWKTRELMANLLRVAAGGGKPHLVFEHIPAFWEAFQRAVEFGEKYRVHINTVECIERALRDRDWQDRRPEGESRKQASREAQVRFIVTDAMRLVAADLLGQTTHKHGAENEIWHAILAIRDSYKPTLPRPKAPPPSPEETARLMAAAKQLIDERKGKKK